jgi:hypothetical protein
MAKRKLDGLEKHYAGQSLDFLKRYGVESIQMGNRTYSKKGKDVIEETPDKKPRKKRSENGSSSK